MNPVFIPSKGRAETIKTHLLFLNCKDVVTLVVEPQDYPFYFKALGGDWKIIKLPLNNQGISYVRNFILELNKEPYWMLDDDITSYKDYSNGTPALKLDGKTALQKAENLFKNAGYGIAQGALEYDQFAWSQKKPISLAGYCDVSVWMNPKLIGKVRYRPELIGKEDRAFTLDLLIRGVMTAKASQIGFSCPSNGSNKGGLHETYYQLGKDTDAAYALAKAYPNYVRVITKKNGRIDADINWAVFKPKKLKSLAK